jgi:hypothetical protein
LAASGGEPHSPTVRFPHTFCLAAAPARWRRAVAPWSGAAPALDRTSGIGVPPRLHAAVCAGASSAPDLCALFLAKRLPRWRERAEVTLWRAPVESAAQWP